MNWDRFFLYLGRFNTVVIALGVIVLLALFGWQSYQQSQWDIASGSNPDYPGFGADVPAGLPISGDEIATADGAIVAYYSSDEIHERGKGAGLTLVDPRTGRSILVGATARDAVIKFELLHDESREGKPAIGYVASVADEEQSRLGRTDLVVGALPALTRNVVARNLRYTDLPTVRGNGSIGVLVWPEEDEARFLAINLEDGTIIEQATIPLPEIRDNTLNQGPGTTSLELRSATGAESQAPRNAFGY